MRKIPLTHQGDPISFASPVHNQTYDLNPTAAIGVDVTRTVAQRLSGNRRWLFNHAP